MSLKYVQKFMVEGSGQFPYDMLRYDRCFPDDESSDSSKLAGDDSKGPRRVTLRRYIESRNEFPTQGRWQSFGWQVILDSVVTVKLP